MKVLLVLCLTAVVLTAEISAYTFRGGDDEDITHLPNFPVKPGFCQPRTCVVEFGRLCMCDSHGVPVCPVVGIYDSPSPIDDLYCNCEPGTVLPSTAACVCPKSGRMPLRGCGRSREPSNFEDSRSAKRQSDNEVVDSPEDATLRKCNYFQCFPTQDGEKCFWVPCPNGP